MSQLLQHGYLKEGANRADQSALEHIRRIRRNMPSQQNSRAQRDFSYDYLTSVPCGGAQQGSNSKIENYKRIKQEEAAARAQLMMGPKARQLLAEPTSAQKGRNGEHLGSLAAHRRNPSHLDRKYKPSENALNQYSPLRN